MKTTRAAHAMPVAYVSIALALAAALMVGCNLQGPGATGDRGQTGPQGDPGAVGYGALQGKVGVAAVMIDYTSLVDARGNAFLNADGARGDLPAGTTKVLGSVDLSTYFAGGQPPITYTVGGFNVGTPPDPDGSNGGGGTQPTPTPTATPTTTPTPSPSPPPTRGRSTGSGQVIQAQALTPRSSHPTPVRGEVTGNRYEYKIDVPTGGFPIGADAPYTMGWSGAITARDAKGVTDTAYISFKMNRHPQLVEGGNLGSGQKTASSGSIAQPPPAGAFLLGTMDPGHRGGLRWHPFATNTPLAARSGVHKACPVYHECEIDVFKDDDAMKITVERMSREGRTTADYVGYRTNAAGNLVFTAIKSTWKNATDGHKPVQVDLKATDGNGLTTTATVYVAVDGAPSLTPAALAVVQDKRFTVGPNPKVIHGDIRLLFSDLERSTALTEFGSGSANNAIARINVTNNRIIVTGVGIGANNRIVVSAFDSRFQVQEFRFFVDVTEL